METSERGVSPTCKNKYLSETITSKKQAVPKKSAIP